jgi:hypothetical protein
MAELNPIGLSSLPSNDAQARELARLPEGDMPTMRDTASHQTPDGPPHYGGPDNDHDGWPQPAVRDVCLREPPVCRDRSWRIG